MSTIDALRADAGPDDVAEAIVGESRRRGHRRDETIAELSTGLQESGLRMVKNPRADWWGYYQQDPSYPDRMDPAGNIRGFLDRLEAKRPPAPGASDDPFANIFWLQQGPNWPSADYALAHGRHAYYDEIRRHLDEATALYDRFAGGAPPAPTPGGPTVPAPNPGWRGDPVFLPDVLRAEGLNVRELDGWRDRGHGDFGAIWGIVAHHTGNNNASAESIAFHPELGLASQLHLARDGTVTVCGAGVAWHAGAGSWPGIADGGANQVTIGIEAANDGGGSPGRPHRSSWPDVQYEAYTSVVAAILRFLGHRSDRVIGHKEWAGAAQGKWDPGAIDMNIFRADIQRKIDRGGALPVLNAIDEVAKTSAWLGNRLTAGEEPTADGAGRFAQFENGYIYWSPTSGAWPIPAHLFEAWASFGWEAGPLGYPVAFHTVIEGAGDVQAFERGVLLRHYGQPGYFVTGMIGNRYRLNDWQNGPLGWPTSNETPHGGMIYQTFEHGRIAWSPDGTIVLDEGNEFI